MVKPAHWGGKNEWEEVFWAWNGARADGKNLSNGQRKNATKGAAKRNIKRSEKKGRRGEKLGTHQRAASASAERIGTTCHKGSPLGGTL